MCCGGDNVNVTFEKDEIGPLNRYDCDKVLYLAKTIHRICDYVDFFKEPKARCVGIVKAYNLMVKGFQKNNAKKM